MTITSHGKHRNTKVLLTAYREKGRKFQPVPIFTQFVDRSRISSFSVDTEAAGNKQSGPKRDYRDTDGPVHAFPQQGNSAACSQPKKQIVKDPV